MSAPELEADAPSTSERARWRRTLDRWPIEVPILFVIAAITRFAALYSPKAIVFDEVYFREYSLHYKAGTYYFDLHPPLGKLLLGAWGWISGVSATALDKDPAVVLRCLPAAAGTLLIIAVYFFIRELSRSRRIATLGAGLLLLDNGILVESRFILIDSMLLFFGMTAVTCALVARRREGRAYWLWWSAAALFGGMAFATKVTGLTALGLVGVLWLVDIFERRKTIREPKAWRRPVNQIALLFVIPAMVYVLTFAVHFALLPKTGFGDAYMPQDFQAQQKGDPLYKPDAHLSFFSKFKELNNAMHVYELQLNTVKHPYSTKWTSWPIDHRGVYIYYGDAGNGKARYIYTLGNPFIWWGTLLGAAVVLGGWAFRRKRFTPYKWPLIFLGVGWAANYLPFALITRPMFLYHYFFALIFSLSFVVVGLGVLTGWINEGSRPWTFPSRWSAVGYWTIFAGALAVFLFMSPITYGIPISPDGLADRMWLSSWR